MFHFISQQNTPEALLAALKAGAYYSSQGPELRDVVVMDDHVEVRCTAVRSIIVQGHGQAAVAVHGQSLTHGRIPLARFAASPWLRVTVVDAAGKRAWSNPFWRADRA